jgi:hypothetical protein
VRREDSLRQIKVVSLTTRKSGPRRFDFELPGDNSRMVGQPFRCAPERPTTGKVRFARHSGTTPRGPANRLRTRSLLRVADNPEVNGEMRV